jgi:SAM-dependent methyltransferase
MSKEESESNSISQDHRNFRWCPTKLPGVPPVSKAADASLRPEGKLKGIPGLCPICGRKSRFLLENSASYNIRECKSCGHIFVANPPSEERLRAFYSNFDYFEDNYNHQGISSIEAEEQWNDWLNARMSALKNCLPKDFTDGKPLDILEIGCLEGRLLAALRTQGHSVCGSDVNAEVAGAGRALFDLDIQLGDFLDCTHAPASFDLVVSFHSFEHMLEPLVSLEKAETLLRPGGYVLLELPANDSEYENFQHLHFFTVSSVNMMFDRVFGNCSVFDNHYTTAHGETMGSLYAVGRKTMR